MLHIFFAQRPVVINRGARARTHARIERPETKMEGRYERTSGRMENQAVRILENEEKGRERGGGEGENERGEEGRMMKKEGTKDKDMKIKEEYKYGGARSELQRVIRTREKKYIKK